jgi:hypothetical protein
MRKKKTPSKQAFKPASSVYGSVGGTLGFMELREAILVNPIMVQELLNSITMLTMRSGLPLKKYSIHTSIYIPITKAWIIDEDMNKQVIQFYGGSSSDEQE